MGQQRFLKPVQQRFPSPLMSVKTSWKFLPQAGIQNGDVPLQKHPELGDRKSTGAATCGTRTCGTAVCGLTSCGKKTVKKKNKDIARLN